MDWTRDGRFLISATLNNGQKGLNDLWALPLSEGRPGKAMPLRDSQF